MFLGWSRGWQKSKLHRIFRVRRKTEGMITEKGMDVKKSMSERGERRIVWDITKKLLKIRSR